MANGITAADIASGRANQAPATAASNPFTAMDVAAVILGVVLPFMLAGAFVQAHDDLNQKVPDKDSARMMYIMAATVAALGIVAGVVVTLKRAPWVGALALAGAMTFGMMFFQASDDYGQGRCDHGFWGGSDCQNESNTGSNVWMITMFGVIISAGAGALVQFGMKRPLGAAVVCAGALMLAGGFLAASLFLLGDLDGQAAKSAEANQDPQAIPGFGAMAAFAALVAAAWVARCRASASA